MLRVCAADSAFMCVCVCVCSMLTSTVFLRPGLIRIGCGAVAGQLRGQTVNVNRELLLYSRQHDTVQSMRYFHSRVVLPALYCQRIRTASLLRRRKHVHVFSSLLLSSYLCRRMTEHYATMLLCCACAARQVLHAKCYTKECT